MLRHGGGVTGFVLATALLAAGPAWAGAPSIAAQVRKGVAPRQRVDNFATLSTALHRCWRPPAAHRFPGMQITVMFSLMRSGDLNGRPRVTYMRSDVPPVTHAAYGQAAAAALARCLPLPLTPAFGDAIAGRPFTIRFIDNRGIYHADNRQRSLT